MLRRAAGWLRSRLYAPLLARRTARYLRRNDEFERWLRRNEGQP